MLKTDRTIQNRVVFGPVRSRRFGESLGINFLPFGRKTCSYDCRYCELGWTTSTISEWRRMAPASTLLPLLDRELEAVVHSRAKVGVLTVAGNGEPTLHPEFPALIEGLLRSRDRWMPHAPVVILSNASTVCREPVRRALQSLDRCYMKLDVGAIPLWWQLNRPSGRYRWHDMLDGLKFLGRVFLQSMVVTGPVDNSSDEAVDRWIQVLRYVRPIGVQLYTLDRVPADLRLLPVSAVRLQEIGRHAYAKTGIPVDIIDPDEACELAAHSATHGAERTSGEIGGKPEGRPA